jgi:hypothetical protein
VDARRILTWRLDAHEQGTRQEEGRQEEAREVAQGEARGEAREAGFTRLTLLRTGFSIEPPGVVVLELRDRRGVAGMLRPAGVAPLRG